MKTNASLLTTAAKVTVDTNVDDYGAAVFEHVTGDFSEHTQALIYPTPYSVPTNFTTGAKIIVTVYSTFKEVTSPAPDIILSGPVGQFTSDDVNFYTKYNGMWEPLGRQNYGVMITGVMSVPALDALHSYSFTLKSAEGSYLWIQDGVASLLVVNNHGAHTVVTKSGVWGGFLPIAAGNRSFTIKSYSKLFKSSGVDLTMPAGISYVSSGITLTTKTVSDSKLFMLMDYGSNAASHTKAVEVPAFFSGNISPVSAVPIITQQPVNQSANNGGTVTFSVAALSSLVITYQWYFNGSPIGGATSPTFTLNSIAFSNAGNYSVGVSNSNGLTMSAIAALTVF